MTGSHCIFVEQSTMMVINLLIDVKIGRGEQKELKRHIRTALKKKVPYM